MHNDFENTQEDKPYLNTYTLTFYSIGSYTNCHNWKWEN